MAENIFANNEMESYKCDANEALTFKLGIFNVSFLFIIL